MSAVVEEKRFWRKGGRVESEEEMRVIVWKKKGWQKVENLENSGKARMS